ncbi:class I SAM-dependent methyltransferase [Variovorax saccharolyticus]|uniref:class I SAM-dependent methyltransferase n=1 Tax=Variovorax saccharolyticus TaxID=3053516 RepID=UPI0025790904|nr:class I SAM-dependent methyltransferase [Variovorax sp. J22R187]MDM0017558.1 class I SAM-dependent methyltransferase [Variovorax sp. J22R187]
MSERLTFVAEAMPYASMLAAEHLSRYALVKHLCADRRVLDIACGEGYGSALMSQWGAKEVCGVDVSEEAIANATGFFGGAGINFVTFDASNCASLRESLGTFDLIVSFETIEHVHDVDKMLRGFKALLADDGAIVISCPNDDAVIPGAPNEFHLKAYSFDDFRKTVTPVLGEPSSWAFGTSVLGFGSFSSDSELLANPPGTILGMMSCQDTGASSVIPAQIGHEVDSSNAAYYVAGWGCLLPTSSVVAPISFRAYESPWNNWLATKSEVERLTLEIDGARQRRIASDITMARLREEGAQAAHFAAATADELQRNLSAMRRINDETVQRWQQTEARLQQIEATRWHRVGAAYYRLYKLPAVGPLLRTVRRSAGAMLRLVRQNDR